MNEHRICVDTIRRLSHPMEPIPTGMTPYGADWSAVRCVLFDVYGTMFISGSGDVGTARACDQQVALYDALSAVGAQPIPAIQEGQAGAYLTEAIQETHAQSLARGVAYPEVDIVSIWRTVLDRMYAEGAVGVPSHEVPIQRLAVEYECRINPVWPMPGIGDCLKDLRRREIPIGIVSNAQFYTPLLFEALLDASAVDLGFDPALCVWSYLLGEGKPALFLFKTALVRLAERGILPEEVLYIGNDMRNDIWAAAQCGCRTALFAGDQRSLRLREKDARCRALKPDALFTNIYNIVLHGL